VEVFRIRILFTGATSFAGRLLHDRLREADHEVIAVSRQGRPDQFHCRADLTSPTLADDLPGGDFDVLVNFASYVPLDERGSQWNDCYQQNVLTIGRLLGWAAGRVGRIVHASSCAVYGADKLYTPTDEDHPLRPDTAYALSKYAQEQLHQAFSRAQDIPVAILRLGYVYGPGLHSSRAIVRLLEMVREGKPIRLTNSNTAGLHLIHVEDIAQVGTAMLTEGAGAYNLTSSRHISLREYVQTCMSVVGRTVEVTSDDDPEAAITNHYSARRLHERHGLRASVSLADGVASLIPSASEVAP
jgi:UDP-glucuronate 4-epimerase